MKNSSQLYLLAGIALGGAIVFFMVPLFPITDSPDVSRVDPGRQVILTRMLSQGVDWEIVIQGDNFEVEIRGPRGGLIQEPDTFSFYRYSLDSDQDGDGDYELTVSNKAPSGPVIVTSTISGTIEGLDGIAGLLLIVTVFAGIAGSVYSGKEKDAEKQEREKKWKREDDERAIRLAQSSRVEQPRREVAPPGDGAFCRLCGTKNPQDSIFCKKCGEKI